jgi:V8-like Glu-specific endopeptidase
MVEHNSILLIATIGLLLQASCTEPAEELCDQPEGGDSEGGGTGAFGDDGPGMSLDHSGVLPPEEPRLISSETQGRAALDFERRSVALDFESSGHRFRNGVFEDPRVPVTDEDVLQSYPLRAVVFVSLTYDTPDGLTVQKGTGFLAGPRHVITNRHVVEVVGVDINDWIDMNPPLFDFDVFPGRSELAPLNGGAWAVERVIWNPFSLNEYNDYALLILEDDIERSGKYGRLGLCSASNNTLSGLRLDTAGYPSSNYTCGQTPAPPNPDNDCPCGGWMYTQSCEISEVDPQELIHTCFTQPGQSGSPLWVDECTSNHTRCTVGIIYGKAGLDPAAVRWRDDDIDWLHSKICQWTSNYAEMPPFCG